MKVFWKYKTYWLPLLVTMAALFAYLSKQPLSEIKNRVEIDIGSVLKAGLSATPTPEGPASLPLTIGCFAASPALLKGKASFKVLNNEECRKKCEQQYLYYIFHVRTSHCSCRDKYDPMYSTKPNQCSKNGNGSIVGIRGNAMGLIVSKFLSNLVRKCKCVSTSCQSITCDHIQREACWAGPRKMDLLKYLRQNDSSECQSSDYSINSIDIVNRTSQTCALPYCSYCVSSENMYGFWPVPNCATYHPTKVTHSQRRLYAIRPPAGKGESVTVFTKIRKDKIKLLLLGYFRSGSTFSSELFRNHHEAFYLFEPFHSVIPRDISKEHEEIHEHLINQTTIAMNSIFNCDLLQVPTGTINRFVQADRISQYCKTRNLIDCVALFISRCQAQKITVVKSIRARMQSVLDLIESNRQPDLKVVLLLRDPRGMMKSRLTTAGSADIKYRQNNTEVKRHASMMCRAMATDAIIARELQKTHSNQILIVHYEDIAKYSTTASNYIYRELGLEKPPHEVIEAIEKLQGSKGRNPFGVQRNDSLSTAYKWKHTMLYDQVKLIDDACRDSYRHIGYNPIQSKEELLDPNNYHKTFIPLI